MDGRKKGSVTGKVCITDGCRNKFVFESELTYYLNNGWRKGSYRYQGGAQIPCKVCGKMINKHDGKHGICAKCMKETGFYRNLWKDPLYRNKVISNATGVKRSEEFKRKQSEDMKSYYERHPERRKAQGEVFSNAWKSGKHKSSGPNCIINRSAAEIMMYIAFVNLFGSEYVSRDHVQGPDNRWCYPDVLLFENIVIEYYGDYWHGNPKVYSPDTRIVDKTALEQQLFDEDRINRILNSNVGTYDECMDNISDVIVIWESDTAHLKTQDDWNAYIAKRFTGYDECISC